RPDTSSPKIYKTLPADFQKLDFRKPLLRFYFDDAFDNSVLNTAVSFTDTLDNNIDFEFRLPDNATVELMPINDWKRETDYLITFDFRQLKDASGNSTDTTVVYKLKTVSGLEFTGVSGIVSADSTTNLILILENSSEKTKQYQAKPNNKAEFNFERVDAGKYL